MIVQLITVEGHVPMVLAQPRPVIDVNNKNARSVFMCQILDAFESECRTGFPVLVRAGGYARTAEAGLTRLARTDAK